MTGLIPENGQSLHEKELSRKSFVKGGGALIIGFSLAGRLWPARRRLRPGTPPTAAGSTRT